jgi:hypothetical protein
LAYTHAADATFDRCAAVGGSFGANSGMVCRQGGRREVDHNNPLQALAPVRSRSLGCANRLSWRAIDGMKSVKKLNAAAAVDLDWLRRAHLRACGSGEFAEEPGIESLRDQMHR